MSNHNPIPKKFSKNYLPEGLDSLTIQASSERRKWQVGDRVARVGEDIKPSIHPSKHRAGRDDRSRSQSPLLPGLPADIAIACLIRVPRVEHWKLRLVCKRWYRLLLWLPLPPVPKEYSEALGFGCAVLSGCHLYLFGGKNKDPLKGSMRRVIFCSARTNKWHRAPDMLRRRHFFGACVMNNCLYIAGGESEGVHRFLRSAEVYDPNKNRWSFVADMGTSMVPFIGVVYNGRWVLKSLGSHRQVLSEVYHPENDVWYPVSNGMVSGWRNPSAFLDGHLYALDCKDGCKLRIYNSDTDSWSKHIDSKLHMGSSRALEATALLPLNGKLCIIRTEATGGIPAEEGTATEEISGSNGVASAEGKDQHKEAEEVELDGKEEEEKKIYCYPIDRLVQLQNFTT
ncbi:hypothetical protein IFM89_013175 [Coptis chinensis]|uniref:F-box domain-containing protein n=1 Tax=Coptis chinensis TaxID=261450 RepID=A0A835LZD9_9MAGN|nr:hypothetical protein IFM89_013175 [Coptis chinensis]